MGLFIQSKRAGHRRFSYQPRFYNPEKEEKLKRRIRVQSKVHRRKSPLGLIYFAMLLLMALLIYAKLG